MTNWKLSCLAAVVAISTMIFAGAGEQAQAQTGLSASDFKQKATQYIQSWNERINKEMEAYYKAMAGGGLPLPLTDAQRLTLQAKMATAREAVISATNSLNSQLIGMTASVLPSDGQPLASFVTDQVKTRKTPSPEILTISANYKWNVKSLKLGSLEGSVSARFHNNTIEPPIPKLPGL